MTRRRQIVLAAWVLALFALWTWQGWPWWALPLLLIAPPAILMVLDFAQMISAMSWMVPFTDLLQTVKSPGGDAARAKLLDAYAGGDRSPITLIALAAAHEYTGDGETALRFAEEAYAQEDGDRLARRHTVGARLKADALVIARADALVVLGRFDEAAALLERRLARTMQRNFMTVLAAWVYFLAGDHANARAILARVRAPGRRFRMSRAISPRYLLLTAYMHLTYQMGDAESARATLVALMPETIAWESTARRHAHNVYGQRLRAVLDDLDRVLAGHPAAPPDT